MANFCSKCGEPLSPDAKFCSACGAQVNSPVNLSKTTETPANDECDNNPLNGGRVPDNGFYENFLRRDGRLNRLRYFKRLMLLSLVMIILAAAVSIVAVVVLVLLFPNMSEQQFGTVYNVLWKIAIGLTLIPNFCLVVRRLHDMDKNENLAYIYIALQIAYVAICDFNQETASTPENVITLISGVIGLYVLFKPGTKGTNQYGADPLN